MIIGIGYQKGSGKDEAAQGLTAFNKIHFATPLKMGVQAMFGLSWDQVWDDAKNEVDPFWGCTPRHLLQFIGTDLIREHIDMDVWVKSVMRVVDGDPKANWVIPDVRFQNEADAILSRRGMLIKVERPDLPESGDTHRSEVEGEKITWHHTIVNDGTIEDLHHKIRHIVYG